MFEKQTRCLNNRRETSIGAFSRRDIREPIRTIVIEAFARELGARSLSGEYKLLGIDCSMLNSM